MNYVDEAQQHQQQDWLPAMTNTTLSYHATGHLDNHHPSPHHQQHTYPSQHLPTHHASTLMESPQLSQHTHSSPPSPPPLPSYTLSNLCPMPSSGYKRSNPYTDDSSPPSHSTSKRRKSASKEAWTMTEDDNLLIKLKDDEGLPWKVIALRFREMGRGEFRVPTLQMRYKRLKEKMRVWDPEDIQYLREAREYVEKQKWELISQRMVEIGCKKKIPGNTCEKKWKELEPKPTINTSLPGSTGPNSAVSAISSTSSLGDRYEGVAIKIERELSQVSEEEGLGVTFEGGHD